MRCSSGDAFGGLQADHEDVDRLIVRAATEGERESDT